MKNWFRDVEKKRAVVIKGNPAYLKKYKKWSDAFYSEIESILVDRGLEVSFDPGLPFTVPKEAEVYVAHSRGLDRLRFVDPRSIRIALETNDPNDGDSEGHYQLSDKDRQTLNEL